MMLNDQYAWDSWKPPTSKSLQSHCCLVYRAARFSAKPWKQDWKLDLPWTSPITWEEAYEAHTLICVKWPLFKAMLLQKKQKGKPFCALAARAACCCAAPPRNTLASYKVLVRMFTKCRRCSSSSTFDTATRRKQHMELSFYLCPLVSFCTWDVICHLESCDDLIIWLRLKVYTYLPRQKSAGCKLKK